MLGKLERLLLGGKPRPTRIITGPNRGLVLTLNLETQTRMWLGRYEEAVLAELLARCDPGRDAWDIGAYIGYVTLALARRSRHVIAVEPDVSNLELLREHVRRNKLPVTVIAAAVRDTPGLARIASNADRSQARFSEIGDEVEAVTLDAIGDRYGFPAVVKIDIEGAEVAALAGASSLLTAGVPFVIEVHGTDDAVRATLETHGYRVRPVGNSFVAARD